MSYWWVNQGLTYKQERRGRYLWAPLRSASGQRLGHWEAMALVSRDDVIFHYADGAIRAVSRVAESARSAPMPSDFPDAWERDGRQISVVPVDLKTPLYLDHIPLKLRLAERGGPFTVKGRVKQGYLFPLSEAIGDELSRRTQGR